MPPPEGDADAPLRALIYDSYYDRYRGAVPSVRVIDGVLKPGMQIRVRAPAPDQSYEVAQVGYNQLRQVETDSLGPGEVGFVVANVRTVKETRAGDTVFDASTAATSSRSPATRTCTRWCSRDSIPRTPRSTRGSATRSRSCSSTMRRCNYEPETSTALGFGFRCGFLGLLHMEIVQERLEREFDLDLVTTVPSVEYHVYRTDGTMELLESPAKLPDAGRSRRSRSRS